MSQLPAPAWPGLRKVVCTTERLVSEQGMPVAEPVTRASAAAVVRNPWAGSRPGSDLAEQTRELAPRLAQLLTDKLVDALGGPDAVESFGKAAAVGTGGELEHAAALIHTPYYGNLVREYLEGESIICFSDDRADAGAVLTVPVWHKTAAATRSHYQTVVVRVPDAPRADEIVIVAAAATGPRPHARIGDRTTDPDVRSETLEAAR